LHRTPGLCMLGPMVLPEDFRLPRDPDRLLREVDAAIKIKDIKNVIQFRDRVQLKWWESGIIILLFMSGLGFVLTIYKLIPAGNPALFWFVFLWFVVFVVTLVATIEFLLAKINALRNLYEINSRILARIEKEMDAKSAPHADKPASHPADPDAR
jgi:hypothetical protein